MCFFFLKGHPNNAVEEFVALTDPKLSLFTGNESDVSVDDQRPTNKITYFRYTWILIKYLYCYLRFILLN